jgi:hypothetical protein
MGKEPRESGDSSPNSTALSTQPPKWKRLPLVPTLRMGMPSGTLCVLRGASRRALDAERRRLHSHAERGNEGLLSGGGHRRGVSESAALCIPFVSVQSAISHFRFRIASDSGRVAPGQAIRGARRIEDARGEPNRVVNSGRQGENDETNSMDRAHVARNGLSPHHGACWCGHAGRVVPRLACGYNGTQPDAMSG